MKTSKRNKLLGLALTGGFSLLGATSVLADAGDTISNFATLQYSVGTTPQTVIESGDGAGNSVPGAGYAVANNLTTDFFEDRVINFLVADTSVTGSAIPGALLQATAFTIQNTSNIALDFLLVGLNNIDGTGDPQGGTADEFDGSAVQTFVEDGTTPGFQAAEDTATFVSSLAELASATVYVVSTIPLVDSGANPLVNTNVAVMTLVAQAAVAGGTGDGTGAIMRDDNGNVSPGGAGFSNGAATLTTVAAVDAADNPAAMDTVYNDPAGTQDGTGAGGAIQNGQNADDNSYTIQTAELTVAKASAALWDPVNLASNPKSIPGGYVTYSVSIANAAGAADASLTTLSDILPASLLLDPDFVTNAGPGNPTNALLDAIEVAKGATTIYCTGDAGDGDGDGCAYTGGAGGTVSVDLSNATFAAIMPLAATETVTVNFNAIVQ